MKEKAKLSIKMLEMDNDSQLGFSVESKGTGSELIKMVACVLNQIAYESESPREIVLSHLLVEMCEMDYSKAHKIDMSFASMLKDLIDKKKKEGDDDDV